MCNKPGLRARLFLSKCIQGSKIIKKLDEKTEKDKNIWHVKELKQKLFGEILDSILHELKRFLSTN